MVNKPRWVLLALPHMDLFFEAKVLLYKRIRLELPHPCPSAPCRGEELALLLGQGSPDAEICS